MAMTKEEVTMVGLEIVAYAGDARTKLLLALEDAQKKNFAACDQLIREADDLLKDAHNAQTDLLAMEARGESAEIGFISIHAQDHLMTTILLRDVMKHLINIYKHQ